MGYRGMALLGRAWRWYSGQMVSHPMRTNVVTGAAVMCVGDAAAQKAAMGDGAEGDDAGIDLSRSLVCTTWAGLFVSPLFYLWFGLLDRRFPGAMAAQVAKKVFINQTVVVLPVK